MRALSVSTFFCFLLLFAAHWSWWTTSAEISSKLSRNSRPIFEGPSQSRILKLDKLEDVVASTKTKAITPSPSKEDSYDKEQFFDLAFQPDTSFHQLEKFKNQIPEFKEYPLFDLLAFLLEKNRLPDNGNELLNIRWSSYLIEELMDIKQLESKDPSLLALKKAFNSKGLITKEYFKTYEKLAYDIELYKDFNGQIDERKLNRALSRLNLNQEQITEYKDGHEQEMDQRY